MLGIQDGFSSMQGEKLRALVADIVYIKLFVGGLFFRFLKYTVVKSIEKTKYKGH